MNSIGVFTHDGPICKDIDGTYCSVTITDEMLSRYLEFVDELVVVSRVKKIECSHQEAKLKPILSNRIKIVEIGNFLSPTGFLKKAKYKKLIKTVVADSSFFFLRTNSVLSDMFSRECLRQNKPYIAEVGGCAWDGYWNHGLTGKIVAPLMFLNARKTVKKAAYVSYVTKCWLQKRYPTKNSSTNASNVYLNNENASTKDIFSRAHGWRSKKVFTVGTIGNVDVKYKGQKYVIKAISLLRKNGIDCRYELVGNGNPAYLKKISTKFKVNDCVFFRGVIKHDDISKWLDSIDIYIQPSKQEGLPRSLIEAMHQGCVCLGSTTAGIPELIDNDLLFKASDWKRIASLIRFLVTSSETSIKKRIASTYARTDEYHIDILNKRRFAFYKEYCEFVRNGLDN